MLIERLYRIFTSLRLTVVLLGFAIVLVFCGTIAQVEMGLYRAQHEFFRSYLVLWQVPGLGLKLPLPGGYTVGGLLLINLIAAHLRYYRPGWKKIGIVLIHLGLVMLIVGQYATDKLAVESYMSIREGEASNYSESNSRFELAIVDTSDPLRDRVVSVPAHLLGEREVISHPELPFTLRVRRYHANSSLAAAPAEGYEEVQAEHAAGQRLWWTPKPHETEMNRRDMPSALLEISGPQGAPGEQFVSAFLTRPNVVIAGGRRFELSLRPQRYYKPFSLQLLDFRFDRYPGTEIPKNFSSRVRILHPGVGEREVVIRMNEPLRYGGETFFQADWDKRDEKGTVLQVVRNPSWLTPYLACVIVSLGLVLQFMIHLVGYISKRRSA